MTRYRIVTDEYAGYEVQAWRWWLPIWLQVGNLGSPVNTWASVNDAEEFARRCMRKHVIREVKL